MSKTSEESIEFYNWAIYELAKLKKLESTFGIDVDDLREQILLLLQEDLHKHLGNDSGTV